MWSFTSSFNENNEKSWWDSTIITHFHVAVNNKLHKLDIKHSVAFTLYLGLIASQEDFRLELQ